MTEQLLMAILNGILLGGLLALLAYGLNLIFGVVKIIHMAYGQFVMLGFYIIYTLNVMVGINLILSCFLTLFIMAVLGVITQLILINPLLKAPRLNQLLALASLIIIMENLAMVIWGADYRAISIQMPILMMGNIFIRGSYLLAFFGALVTMGFLHIFLNKTYTGLAIKSVSQDLNTSSLMGINPKLIYCLTLGMGGVLTGLVAAFFVPIYSVSPHFGASFTTLAFIIVILGGMGNLLGGFISAFIIGVITSVAAALTTTEVADIIVLIIFVVAIIFRPQGILGAKV